jgi:hypothetical protein
VLRNCWTGTKMWNQFRRARTVIPEDFNSKRISLSLYFRPCLVRDGEFHWAVGPNKLLLIVGCRGLDSHACLVGPRNLLALLQHRTSHQLEFFTASCLKRFGRRGSCLLVPASLMRARQCRSDSSWLLTRGRHPFVDFSEWAPTASARRRF